MRVPRNALRAIVLPGAAGNLGLEALEAYARVRRPKPSRLNSSAYAGLHLTAKFFTKPLQNTPRAPVFIVRGGPRVRHRLAHNICRIHLPRPSPSSPSAFSLQHRFPYIIRPCQVIYWTQLAPLVGRQGSSRTLIAVLAHSKTSLKVELIQTHTAQKPVLRGEVGCACVAREVSVERGGMGERGCARRLDGWVWV